MRRYLISGLVICSLAAAVALPVSGEDGVGEQIGRHIDRGLTELGNEFRQGWNRAKQSLDQLGLQGRVYARLHWDKQLSGSTLDVEIREGDVVILKGSVSTSAAREKAEQLAGDTIGVAHVVNQLAIR